MMKRDNIAQTDGEIAKFIELLDSTKELEGNIAEVGVFHGGTASIIHDHMADGKKLYLYDTYVDDYDGVVNYFADKKNVEIIKCDFNNTQTVEGHFSFIHLDTDLYDSTLAGLEKFYPKMVKGGVIIVHDYTHITCAGPQIACCNFFADKPETVTKNDSQGYYIKQ